MAVFLQENVHGSVEALTALMETAVNKGADLVLVQEPPASRVSDILALSS